MPSNFPAVHARIHSIANNKVFLDGIIAGQHENLLFATPVCFGTMLGKPLKNVIFICLPQHKMPETQTKETTGNSRADRSPSSAAASWPDSLATAAATIALRRRTTVSETICRTLSS